MGLQALSSRAIIGSFYKKLFQDNGASWVSKIAMTFNSDQESETPGVWRRERVQGAGGPRQA